MEWKNTKNEEEKKKSYGSLVAQDWAVNLGTAVLNPYQDNRGSGGWVQSACVCDIISD